MLSVVILGRLRISLERIQLEPERARSPRRKKDQPGKKGLLRTNTTKATRIAQIATACRTQDQCRRAVGLGHARWRFSRVKEKMMCPEPAQTQTDPLTPQARNQVQTGTALARFISCTMGCIELLLPVHEPSGPLHTPIIMLS